MEKSFFYQLHAPPRIFFSSSEVGRGGQKDTLKIKGLIPSSRLVSIAGSGGIHSDESPDDEIMMEPPMEGFADETHVKAGDDAHAASPRPRTTSPNDDPGKGRK